jgi:hypothetical protein
MAVSKKAMQRFLKGRGTSTGGKTRTPGTPARAMVKRAQRPVPGLKLENRAKGY